MCQLSLRSNEMLIKRKSIHYTFANNEFRVDTIFTIRTKLKGRIIVTKC